MAFVTSRVARAVALAASAAAAASSVSPARAAAPVPVSLQATVTQGFSGVWQAAGAIDDSGSFVRTEVDLTGSVPHSPVVGAFTAEFAFAGSMGTFLVRDELLSSATGVHGTWQIESGTRAYDVIQGHGTSSFDFSTATITFTGVISLTG